MLLSQGWTPGTYLGVLNAPHAHLHSDANASHIRVAVKDDNLGLGATRGSGVNVGQCVGLDAFQGLLGRLNGKSEGVLEKEQKSRDDLKRAIYTERRWGALRFVSGGVLVGDKIQKLVESEKLRAAKKATQSSSPKPPSMLHNESTNTEVLPSTELPPNQVDFIVPARPSVEHKIPEREGISSTTGSQCDENNISPDSIDDLRKSIMKAKKKAERAQKKLDRRKIKEERRAALAGQVPLTFPSSPTSLPIQEVDVHSKSTDRENCSGSASAGVTVLGARHAIRNRYIVQKKMAMMDPKALNEVGSPHLQASSLRNTDRARFS